MDADKDQITELVVSLRRERDQRRAAGADTGWMDQVLGELEPLTEDLDVVEAIHAVIERHGPGPYPADELAIIAGVDADKARRFLAWMVTAGLAEPPPNPHEP